MKVFNKSKVQIEKAEKIHCPRCKGAGGISADHGNGCFLCDGKGIIWMSKEGSGYTRALYRRVLDSILY